MQAWWLFNTDKVQQTPFSHTFCSLALTRRARGKLFVDATSAGTNLASWLNTNRLCESCFTQGAQRAPQSCHATLSRSKPNMEVFLGSGRWPSFPQSHKTESSRHKRNQFIHATNRTTSVFQSYDLKIKNGGKRRKCKYPAYLYVLTHRLSIGLDWSSVTALSCLIPTYLFSFMMQVSRTSSRALNLFWPAKKKKKKKTRGSWKTNHRRADPIRLLFLLLFTPPHMPPWTGRWRRIRRKLGRHHFLSVKKRLHSCQWKHRDDPGSKWRSWWLYPAGVNSFYCSHWLWRLIMSKWMSFLVIWKTAL